MHVRPLMCWGRIGEDTDAVLRFEEQTVEKPHVRAASRAVEAVADGRTGGLWADVVWMGGRCR